MKCEACGNTMYRPGRDGEKILICGCAERQRLMGRDLGRLNSLKQVEVEDINEVTKRDILQSGWHDEAICGGITQANMRDAAAAVTQKCMDETIREVCGSSASPAPGSLSPDGLPFKDYGLDPVTMHPIAPGDPKMPDEMSPISPASRYEQQLDADGKSTGAIPVPRKPNILLDTGLDPNDVLGVTVLGDGAYFIGTPNQLRRFARADFQ